MKLNHINLTVTDVSETVKFLEKYFGLQSQGGNKGMAFLYDDDGFDVEPPQRHHAWTFYVQAPGGFTVEVLA
jgi:catechol 2,3-dioxygenase-like lactoylglutathione lyase family enzyme